MSAFPTEVMTSELKEHQINTATIKIILKQASKKTSSFFFFAVANQKWEIKQCSLSKNIANHQGIIASMNSYTLYCLRQCVHVCVSFVFSFFQIQFNILLELTTVRFRS